MPNNCINCGAILHGNKCEYCGTEYSGNAISAKFSENDYVGTFQIGNKVFKGYIGCMEINPVALWNCYRDADGKIHAENIVTKRRFTVIEI